MLLEKAIEVFKPSRFVQVGAYDGTWNDPIHEYIINLKWNGLLVEPNPKQYNKLVNAYKGCDGLIFENVAISSSLDVVRLFVINSDQSRTTMMKKNRNVWRNRHKKNGITTIHVPAVSLEKLIAKHNLCEFDLLCIDVEGAELEVLTSLNLEKYHPKIIYYENKHVKMLGLYKQLYRLLARSGYKIYKKGVNDLAVRHRV